MSQLRIGEFKRGTRAEVEKYMDEADETITKLWTVREILKKRRDSYIAHTSPTLVSRSPACSPSTGGGLASVFEGWVRLRILGPLTFHYQLQRDPPGEL